MPLVTLTVRTPKSSAFKSTMLNAVHAALVSAGVPAADKFQRVLELEAEGFRFDPTYPDVKTDCSVFSVCQRKSGRGRQSLRRVGICLIKKMVYRDLQFRQCTW